MKTLYIDCGMGAAGDMLSAALLELVSDQDKWIDKLNGLHIPGVIYQPEKVRKCGIIGTQMKVFIHGEEEAMDTHHNHEMNSHSEKEHHHTGMSEIAAITEKLEIPDKVRQDVINIYDLIAEAESQAHGMPVEQIHFHEVGNMDAIADITAVCLLLHEISPEQIIVSPVHVGSGHVKCAHGVLPVPAPATAIILRDVPIYSDGTKGELCTPTGAALLKYFATQFGDMPIMKTKVIGYGMGKKDFQTANCVRMMLGDTNTTTEHNICLDEVRNYEMKVRYEYEKDGGNYDGVFNCSQYNSMRETNGRLDRKQ